MSLPNSLTRAACLLSLGIACAMPTAAAALSRNIPVGDVNSLESSINAAKSRVYPALVNIFVVFRYYDGGRVHRDLAGGSGVIISPDGYVITNYHVAGHTTHITCTLADHQSFDARDVYDDPMTDISVLKLNLPQKNGHVIRVPYAVLGNSNLLHAGQFVMAMGNPLMLSSSLTLGVVSNKSRVFTNFTGTRIEDQTLDDGQVTGLLTRWIQHDALILPGNSGGPLVNMQGQVVGINELGGNGVGFAIPSNLVLQVYHSVLRYGRVVRGSLGFSPMPVQKMGRTTGTLVSSVLPGSSAAKAGLKAGDVLLDINGKPTNTLYFEQIPLLYQMVASLKPGTTAHLRVAREGSVLNLPVVVSPMQPAMGHESEVPALGISVRRITPMMALRHHLPDTSGAMIRGILPGMPVDGAQPKLSDNDVIRAVDGKEVGSPADLRKMLKELGKKDTLVLTCLHKGEKLLTVLNMKQQQNSDDNTDLPHAWLGVKTQVLIPEIAATLHLQKKQGFLITQVLPYTQAAAAGLKTGDVITELNGSPLQASRLQDADVLKQEIENLSVDSKAAFTILRNGKALQVPVTLQAEPASVQQAVTYRDHLLECTVRNVTLFDRIEQHWSASQKGVIVSDITEGGWANVGGLNLKDLILSVNGIHVTDTLSYKKAMRTLRAKHPHVITLFVRRGPLTDFVFIEPEWKQPSH